MEQIIKYIMSFLLGENNLHLLECIGYSEHSDEKIIIIPSGFFDKSVYMTKNSIPELPLKLWEGLPILFGQPKIEYKYGKVFIYADIIASSFFLITRYEEYININNYDEHGRFIGKNSFSAKAGILERPLVDEYSKKLRYILEVNGFLVNNSDAKGKIYLTHDVDIPWRKYSFTTACKHLIHNILKNKKIELAPLINYLGCYKVNPFNTFSWLVEHDGKVKKQNPTRCEDIYFIIANKKETRYTPSYITDEKANKLLKFLFSSASHIGVHLSYEAGNNNCENLIINEVKYLSEKLGQRVTYNRNHYLLSNSPSYFRLLIKAGITDDYTMGFADRVGFRLGTSKCVKWIDAEKLLLTNLNLHPLNVMDNTLCEPQYLGLDEENSFDTILKLFNLIEEVGGDFCVLFHNSMLKTGDYQWLSSLYDRVIKMLEKRI